MSIRQNDDGSLTVDLTGLPTNCARCFAQIEPGTANSRFSRFDEPIPASDGFPEVKGIWIELCDSCAAVHDQKVVTVDVEGKFVRGGRGPLGQSAARHPIGPDSPRLSTRPIEMTAAEAARLTQCTMCGRATVNPGFHLRHGGRLEKDLRRLPHCETCGSHTKVHEDVTYLDGWYGMFEVVD